MIARFTTYLEDWMLIRRTMAILAALSFLALAQPPLVSIGDVLYKANGTRFSGSAVITWNSFQSADTSNIATQSVTVPIVNGNLFVQLVPNADATPPNPYLVRYQSDGLAQFSESWTVPRSDHQLRLKDIRNTPNTGANLPPAGQTPILEADVVGLLADLGLRPVKGPSFGLGRAAVISSSGAVETVVGNLSDCVRVDGTAGPCADPAQNPAFIDAESPLGIVDGANDTFGLANSPSPASSLALYRNGLLQKTGSDYTLTSGTVQFLAGAIPQAADTLLASYRIGGAGMLAGGLSQRSQAPGLLRQPAEVVCSSTGTTTTSTLLTSLGNCTVGGNTLQPGDRVEIRFSYAHSGATGFAFQVRWGATTLVSRSAGASDTMIAGRADAGLDAMGAQLSVESWGTALSFAAGVSNSSDSITAKLRIDFLAQASAGSVTLRNYTVLRYPGVSHP
ncbi:MAG: hypothetical protein M3Z23_10065 [Acidobacteriota bacterium]|nr:hypothetical protein [Acidobacteriota bacterium]